MEANGSCSDLECVVTNDDACGLASQVWWLAEQDTVYLAFEYTGWEAASAILP
jgi:hypothetical protein